MPEQPHWIEKAKETYSYHRSKLISDEKWNTTKTAKALRRSIGSISEDLLICKWLKTSEEELVKFKYAYEALEWIREKQREEELEKID